LIQLLLVRSLGSSIGLPKSESSVNLSAPQRRSRRQPDTLADKFRSRCRWKNQSSTNLCPWYFCRGQGEYRRQDKHQRNPLHLRKPQSQLYEPLCVLPQNSKRILNHPVGEISHSVIVTLLSRSQL
jgi:hypothetical protein